MVEYAAQTKDRDAVTGVTIQCGINQRMPGYRTGRGDPVAGIAAIAGNLRSGMVRVRAGKTRRVMAGAAFGSRLMREICVHGSGGDGSIVTTGALSNDIRMIKAAIWVQFQKMGRVMAIIAFGGRGNMVYRLSNRGDVIVTFAAHTKHFLMIHGGNWRESQRGMTSLAEIAGRNMDHRFASGVQIVMTARAANTGNLGAAMVDNGKGEAQCVMAGTAVLGSRNMVAGFLDTDHPVVTGSAGVQIQVSGRMIECPRGE